MNPKYDLSILWRANSLIGDRTTALMFAAYGNFYRLDEPMACYRRELKKENKSVTWSQYHKSKWIEDELVFTERLEEYAREELKRDAKIECYKRRLLVSAAYQMLKKPNKENFITIKKVFTSLQHPFVGVVLLPWLIGEKIILRMK